VRGKFVAQISRWMVPGISVREKKEDILGRRASRRRARGVESFFINLESLRVERWFPKRIAEERYWLGR
jgi:hypothetical protein